MARLSQKGLGSVNSYKRGNGPGPLVRPLILCCVVSIALLGVSSAEGDSGPIHAARGVFQTITMPVRYLGSAVASPFAGLGNVFTNLTANQESLSELEAENEQLKSQVAELTESDQTATRLEDLLQLKSTYSLQSTAARIVSGSGDSWSTSVTIDKGTTSGFAVGMPVTDSMGVIGQITECGPSTSVVRLISDESSGVSAMVQSSRAQGQLTGSADGTLHLTLIKCDQQVVVGDTVVTSGLGGVYPKGLPIGTVTSVEKSDGALYYDITVSQLASTENLEEVLVITSLSEDQQASTDEVSAADSQERSEATTADTASATTTAATTTSATTDEG
ncbi:MAG: rod shape-determining protein MreC [Atopobiaceae bacterium]|nr:rod shape-determining protein MreC [Atopobiaceae bacterium]MDD3177091.1 rod shape-determining protein MreC [Atopobiaceae bacterium]MDD3485328.1 rod shape-determining protein MreC [Atopobiaceae bacterium]MDD4379975.1 rod shape-determining protein MreC [Atopobiaceae bacterium]